MDGEFFYDLDNENMFVWDKFKWINKTVNIHVQFIQYLKFCTLIGSSRLIVNIFELVNLYIIFIYKYDIYGGFIFACIYVYFIPKCKVIKVRI